MAQITPIQAGGKLGSTDGTTGAVAGASPSAFANDGQTMLMIVVGATPTTLNMTPPNCSHGRAFASPQVLSASKTWLLGPFPQAEFNDASGNANFTLSSTATVTMQAVKIPVQ